MRKFAILELQMLQSEKLIFRNIRLSF